MKKIALVISAMLAFAGVNALRAEVVEIGTGTATENTIPVNTNYIHSWNQSIYLKSEINHDQAYILGIAFNNKQSEYLLTGVSLKIYLSSSDKSSFTLSGASNTSRDFVNVPSNLLVYESSNDTLSKGGWNEYIFSSPRWYEGKNIIVSIAQSHSMSRTSSFYCTSYTDRLSLNVGSVGDPIVNPQPGSTTGFANQARANIRFIFGNNVEVDGLYYDISNIGSTNEVRLGNNQSCTKEQITLPSQVTIYGKVYNVTSIGEGAFSGNTSLKSITIPSSITSIKKEAFKNCTSLKTIFVEGQSTALTDGNQFQGCTNYKILVPKDKVSSYKSSWSAYSSSIYSSTLDIQVTSAGYATGYSIFNLVVPAGVEVYGYCYDEFANVLLAQEAKTKDFVIPGQKGFVVKAAAGTYSFKLAPNQQAGTFKSDLKGYMEQTSKPAGVVYGLGAVNGKVAFYKYDGLTIPGGKAIYVKAIN